MLDLCCTAETHWLHVRDLKHTHEDIHEQNKDKVQTLSVMSLIKSHIITCINTSSFFLSHLSSNQLQQGTVDWQQVNVRADRCLVKGARLAVQLVKAGLTHCVGAAQADGLVAAAVKLIVADGAGQELCPLGRLHWHAATAPLKEASPSSVGRHVSEPQEQLLLASADAVCEGNDSAVIH